MKGWAVKTWGSSCAKGMDQNVQREVQVKPHRPLKDGGSGLSYCILVPKSRSNFCFSCPWMPWCLRHHCILITPFLPAWEKGKMPRRALVRLCITVEHVLLFLNENNMFRKHWSKGGQSMTILLNTYHSSWPLEPTDSVLVVPFLSVICSMWPFVP